MILSDALDDQAESAATTPEPDPPEPTRLELRLSIDLRPGEGQSAFDARMQFLETVTSYLRDLDGPFLSDFGIDAWGGYAGPYVLGTHVATASESTGAQLIADELQRQTLAELHGHERERVPARWRPTGVALRDLPKVGAAIARRIDEFHAHG